MIWITLGIIISSLGGLFLTRYIARHKYSEDHMTCPLGQKCEPLVTGRFSKFLGIPVEYLGTLYFSIFIFLYTVSLFKELPDQLLLAGILLSGVAFAFSMYLTMIQIIVLKKWCTICLAASAISFVIIVLVFMGYEYSFAEFAYTYRDLLKWIYMSGVIIGTIVTTFHAKTFIRFLRDFHITRREEARLEMFSHIAWVAIGLSFLSGLGLVLTDRWREFTDSSSFMVMVLITGILIVYEIIVNMVISPKLVGMHFGDEPELDDHKHSLYRKTAFAFIGVGVVSWYSLFLLSVFDWFEYTNGQLFMGYVILVVLAVSLTMLIEVMIYRKSLHSGHDDNYEE